MSTPAEKGFRVLACAVCQARKVKCDRKFPCSNCVKADVECIQGTSLPRRKRLPNQDLQQRLAKCEELLSKYASAAESKAPVKPQTAEYGLSDSIGRLILNDSGSTTYTDNVIFAGIQDELRGMKQIINDESLDYDHSTPADSASPDEHTALFLADSPLSTSEEHRPQPAHAVYLWQVFLDRVNPLTKIIHVPTVQPVLAEATTNPAALPKNQEALLFAIYLMAIISMTDAECQSKLFCSRRAAIDRFSRGIRMALMAVNILKTNDFIVLQALTLYLIFLCSRYEHDAAWALNGTIIRIAQKLGLHRDGKLLGLPPFETEMRRRVWWQIIIFDVYCAVVSGVGKPMLPDMGHVKEPTNVNDSALFPGVTAIEAKEGPTEMIYCLFNIMVRQLFVKLPKLDEILSQSKLQTGDGIKPTVEKGLRYLDEFQGTIADLLNRYGDPSAGPVHDFCFKLAPMFLGKLRELLTSSRLDSIAGLKDPAPNDQLFRMSVLMTERKIGTHQACLPTNYFSWFAKLQFHPDILKYLAARLSTHPSGPYVERAWTALEQSYGFQDDLYDLSFKNHTILAGHVLRAWQVRLKIALDSNLETPPKPSYIQTLEILLPSLAPVAKPAIVPDAAYPTVTTAAADQTAATEEPSWDQLLDFFDAGAEDWNLLLESGHADMPLGNWN